MSVQKQVSRGVPLDGGDCWRLLKIAEVAAQLGVPDAVLGVWPYGVYLFAANDLASQSWWFSGALRWRRVHTQSRRALIAPPAEIAHALSRVGGPRVRVGFGKDRARFLGPDGAVEVRGRTAPSRDVDAILVRGRGYGPIFAIVEFVVDELRSAASGARGILELRIFRSPGADSKWEAYVVNGGSASPLQIKTLLEPERDIVGRYSAAVLGAVLSLRTEKHLGIMFTGSPESPALLARWGEPDGIGVEFLMRPLG